MPHPMGCSATTIRVWHSCGRSRWRYPRRSRGCPSAGRCSARRRCSRCAAAASSRRMVRRRPIRTRFCSRSTTANARRCNATPASSIPRTWVPTAGWAWISAPPISTGTRSANWSTEDVPSSVVPLCLALKGVPGRKAQVLAHEAPQYISAQKSWRPHPGQQPSSASGQFIESAVLTRHRRLDGLGKRGIADQEAEFDIPILGAEREVGAGKQQHLVVDNNELCRG